MAQRRRSTPRSSPAPRTSTGTRRPSRRAPKQGGALPRPRLSLGLSPAVLRSLVGIVLLMLGAISLIALALPGGSLTDWWRDLTVPFFGAARFLFPLVLLLAGWYVEWGPGREPGAPWGRTLLGITLAYVAFLGVIQVVNFRGEFTGGRIGRCARGAAFAPADHPRRVHHPGRPDGHRDPDRVRHAAAIPARPADEGCPGGRVHAPGPDDEARRGRGACHGAHRRRSCRRRCGGGDGRRRDRRCRASRPLREDPRRRRPGADRRLGHGCPRPGHPERRAVPGADIGDLRAAAQRRPAPAMAPATGPPRSPPPPPRQAPAPSPGTRMT